MPFKKDFAWGAATASYQIEGAWNEDGKGLNIWDDFTHQGGKIDDNSTGDIACDHYHKFKEDVKLMSELGLKAYRFSLSWSRILPEGTGRVNQKGIDFYNALIDELLKYNITPYVTIYHWDLPYALHQQGGWLNPKISDYFEEYATVVAKNFGDRVHNFITLNETSVFMGCGYFEGSHAPGFKLGNRDLLQIGHNILMAHGKAVKAIRQNTKNSKIGITLATQPKIPVTPEDIEPARAANFWEGIGGFFWSTNYWLDPIVFGKYNQKLIDEAKPDIVVNGIAGMPGLLPSKITLENGIDIALANKETIVMAGPLIKELAKSKGAHIIPVDSEHSAIFNLVEKIGKNNISKIVITASGGPFRTSSKEELEQVTVEQALKHPTWQMGNKITIDSATLANKGLEVIEAAYLFDVTADQIEVVVHPQSLIHSLVRTNDGMLYAQISDPDMKHPIFGALTWPENKQTYLEPFDLFDHTMTFFKPRLNDFPLLNYAFECVKAGNGYTIAFNAANEVAVHAFLNKQISFTAISRIVRTVLDHKWQKTVSSFEEVFEIDSQARSLASEQI